MEKTDLNLAQKLSEIQIKFKAQKTRYNSFGKYHFRSAEDLLEGLKPFNAQYGVFFTVSEDYLYSHDLPVIISKAAIHDIMSDAVIEVKAIVGVDLQQKGMQTPQAFGSASSYGKKYALGNLLLIDDTADADATATHGKEAVVKTKLDVKDDAFEKAKQFVVNGGSIDTIKGKYDLSKEAVTILSKL
jgi:hypothetical protein